MDLDLADKLLRLATDPSTTEDERRSAAVQLARMIKESDFFPTVRLLVEKITAMVQWFRDNRRWFRSHGVHVPWDL